MTKIILKGTPASTGKVKSTACVVNSLDEIGKFKAGDILITSATSPNWTPFIHASSGVVTELGGMLSHAAIVTREYGIPSVVGVKNAAKNIENGRMVIVDGDNGLVEMI